MRSIGLPDAGAPWPSVVEAEVASSAMGAAGSGGAESNGAGRKMGKTIMIRSIMTI